MKKQDKHLLQDNHGVALVMVMFLLLMMTFMGGTMYAYTMQSLKVLEYGTNRQKAEYIARSGIEASVFMYQDAMLKETSTGEIHQFLEATKDDGNEATDETITTNWIYLCKDAKTYEDGGDGNTPTVPTGKSESDYIGYFRVKITNDKQAYTMPTEGGGSETKYQPIKRFESEGHCKNQTKRKKAYIMPLIDVNAKGWINANGEVDLPEQGDETSMIQTTYISIDCGWIDTLVEKAKSIITKVNQDLMNRYPGLTDKLPTYENGRINNLPLRVAATAGNMVLNSVEKESTTGSKSVKEQIPIRFKKGPIDNAAGFLSLGNLFVNGNIDTEPSPTHFNSLILRGNKIVINGDVDLYVYDPQTNNANGFNSWISGLAAKIARNYRFSTVIIGTPSKISTTVTDPMPKAKGGLGQCGQIFFGGDVYVNFITRGGRTRRYKAFSAGEIYYFNGSYMIKDSKTGTETPLGIDLLKFFLDTEMKKSSYSPQVIQQFKRTRDFYYSKSNEYYTEKDMRKIEIKKENTYDSIVDTVVPSPGDGSYIIWE